MGFWKNVEIELEYQGMSRKELAFKINKQEITVHKAIERDSEVSALTAFAVSEAINIPIEKLLEIQISNSSDDISVITKESNLFRKYSFLIKKIESLSPEKQKLVLNVNKTLLSELEK